MELDKALVIHCRASRGSTDAYDDMLEIISKYKEQNPSLRFEVHSFTGSWSVADKIISLGGYLGLNGIITFDKTGILAEVVQKAPLEHILLETDSPYLAPAPNRGKRNEPAFVVAVAEKIAELKGVSVQQVAETTTTNANKFFRLP